MDIFKRVFAQINLNHIEENLKNMQALVGRESRFLAVIKTDGYGHGAVPVAEFLEGKEALYGYAVATIEEALELRGHHIKKPILVLGYTFPEQYSLLTEHNIIPTVFREDSLQALSEAAVKAGRTIPVHIKVDTGMGRIGFPAEVRMAEQVAEAVKLPHIKATGIYTHFAHAFDPKATKQQYEAFCSVLAALEKEGIDPGVRHCCNSVATFRYPEMALDAVRAGSCLLGRILGGSKYGLQRTGMCHAGIECVRTLPKGSTIGYGSIYRTKKETKVALCSVGGHHGFGLSLKPGLQSTGTGLLDLLAIVRNRLTKRDVPTVTVGGKQCRVLGCICSEAVMIDVTNVSCQPGDVAQFDINPLMLNDMEVEYV